jgi:hypothetical protein
MDTFVAVHTLIGTLLFQMRGELMPAFLELQDMGVFLFIEDQAEGNAVL